MSSGKRSQDHVQTSKPVSDRWTDAPFYTGRKVDGWFDDAGELAIYDYSDLDTEENYLVKYREGRFGGEVLPYGRFNDLGTAYDYTGLILSGEVGIDELLQESAS